MRRSQKWECCHQKEARFSQQNCISASDCHFSLSCGTQHEVPLSRPALAQVKELICFCIKTKQKSPLIIFAIQCFQHIFFPFFVFFFNLLATPQSIWDLFSLTGIKPIPLFWRCGVLTTGWPGKSSQCIFRLFTTLDLYIVRETTDDPRN